MRLKLRSSVTLIYPDWGHEASKLVLEYFGDLSGTGNYHL